MSRFVTIAERTRMRALRAEGASLSDIECEFPQWSSQTIYNHVKDIPPPPQGWKKCGPKQPFNGAKAIKLRAQGFSYRELGARFGVDHVTVWHACKKYRLENAA